MQETQVDNKTGNKIKKTMDFNDKHTKNIPYC